MKKFKIITNKRKAKKELKKEGRNVVWSRKHGCFFDKDKGGRINDIQLLPPWERINLNPEDPMKDRTDFSDNFSTDKNKTRTA